MGNSLSHILRNPLRTVHKRSIMVVGLDNVGKTTLLCTLTGKQEEMERAALAMGLQTAQTLPTPGVQLVEYVTSTPPLEGGSWRLNEVTQWQVWDMSGQGRYRDMWKLYAGQVDGIIFVVDLADGPRIAVAYRELQLLVESERVKGRHEPMPLAFCCTKKDLAEALATGGSPSTLAASAGVSHGGTVDPISEEEARKGLGVDALKAGGANVTVLRWHFGEDIEVALQEIGRQLDVQKEAR